MSAFLSNLIALSWNDGQYEVVAQTIAQIDSLALQDDGILHNVSKDSGYLDEAAIVQHADFVKYLLPDSNPWHKEAQEWYSTLPRETMFIIVHLAEWESGLGD